MKIFYLPDLGEGLAEAEIRQWYIKVGDVVKVDQPLVSMETAKAVVDVPSPYTGKILELHGQANNIIKTGSPLITFETNETIQDKGSVVGKLETSETMWDDGDIIIGSAKNKSISIKAMPAARMFAKQMNIDLAQVIPTGPQGLITVEDVKQQLAQTSSPKKLTGRTELLHGVRRVMAQAMAQSHQEVVPVTINEDADITDLPPNVDFTAYLLKAMAAAVKIEPALNAWFDGTTLERKLFSEVHIGLAVDTTEGLFVPVIRNVEQHSLNGLRQIIDKHKEAVNTRTLHSTEMQGATITLSNFGTIAGRYATPIIIPPAVAILGCGRGRDAILPRDGKITIGRVVPLSLTIDHRAVTGGEASRFLEAIIRFLATP